MERLSVFDIFKIGVGPSSSHTLGPWKAAKLFREQCFSFYGMGSSPKIQVHLLGSLSKTGRGHGTDIAVMLGLCGYDPVTIDTKKIDLFVQDIRSENTIPWDQCTIHFEPARQIIFEKYSHEFHANTLIFSAELDGKCLTETYFSVGGGFIEKEGEEGSNSIDFNLPYPIDTAQDLLNFTNESACSISDIVYQNELTFRNYEEVKQGIRRIHLTILECIYKGCHTEGILPGGLDVKRRAKEIAAQLLPKKYHETGDMMQWLGYIKDSDPGFNTINRWISAFALAVNEENASFGRVVTSPTNGAAGVIPAVLMYYICFCEEVVDRAIERFFYTSGEIGSLFKKGATISAAMGGCQAEIGVSSAMAAGGLTEILGGSPQQVLMAAEIAMEHHLGLTCDPIGGLVQIPCIERNAMGAMKAITACNIALSSDANSAKVSLDAVIKTMWETAKDMNHKYKETAEGGLAIQLPVIQPSC